MNISLSAATPDITPVTLLCAFKPRKSSNLTVLCKAKRFRHEDLPNTNAPAALRVPSKQLGKAFRAEEMAALRGIQ